MPISALDSLCLSIKPFLTKEQILVDMCSVKEYPHQILNKHFPENEIIGTHPLFGPDSTPDGLAGRQIVLSPPENFSAAYIYLKEIFSAASLVILEMSPAEHDRQMAWTLCLTQFIGRALGRLPLPQNGIGTKGYFDLLDIVTRANADTLQLYMDMNKYNPYAAEMRKRVVESFRNLDSTVIDVENDGYQSN